MNSITIAIPDDLSAQLEPYRDNVDDLLRLGLREVKKAQSLALFRQSDISLWKAARLADVSLREMIQYAVAHGLRASVDDETIQEELT